MFIAANRAVPSTSSTPLMPPPASRSLFRSQVVTVVVLDVVIRRQQEAARAARRVTDRVVRAGMDAVDHHGNQFARGKILTGPGLDVLGSLCKQLLIGVTLDVHALARPLLFIDQIDDQLLQLGWVLDSDL